ncbi:MAG: ABC transporter permease [Acidimicrobiales bacterium]
MRPLARVVASLGLLLYLIATANLHFGGDNDALAPVAPLLPDRDVELLGGAIPLDRFLFAGSVALVTTLLWALYRFTRFGLAARAAAESEKGAVLTGHSPERLAALNWMLASVLAGVGVATFANIGRRDPLDTSLLVVPALAAALLGRFESIVVTAAAGLAIGVAHTEILNLRGDLTWLPKVDLQEAVPLVVIILAMVLRGRSLPVRGALVEPQFPSSPRPIHRVASAVLLSVGAVVILFTAGTDLRGALITSMVAVLISLSVVVLTGYVGQISLAPMAFAGLAAFAMVKFGDGAHLPFPLAPLAAATVAMGAGLLAGLPAVRVRGMSLAVVTIAAALAIEKLVLGWSWFAGGSSGAQVPDLTVAGADLSVSRGTDFQRPAFGLVCLAVVILAAVAVANLRRSPTGLRWLAVRANEKAAAAAGINVAAAKLSAFAAASFLAGLGGTLLAYKNQALSPDSFSVFNSLSYLALTYLGGIASISGALVAGALSQEGLVTQLTSGGRQSQYQFAISGVALIVVAILAPSGITGVLRSLARRVAPVVSKPGNAK